NAMPTPESAAARDRSRRDFLARTAAVAGVAALGMPLAARAGGPEPAAEPAPRASPRAPLGPDQAIRLGVIGTGGMGTGHCEALISLVKSGLEKAEIVALSDVCQPRLDEAKRRCESGQQNQVAVYRKYPGLLAREDIHGVVIAAPEHWHAQMAVDAIAAGKDVYLEKPMTLDLPDALRLRRAALANPEVMVQVGTQQMQVPKWHEARKLIAEGGIGKPTFSQTSYCRNSRDGEWLYYAIDPAWKPGENLDWEAWCGPLGAAPWDPQVYARWRRYRKYSTGIIGDLLVHVMTPLVMALDMGWPTRVIASGGHYVDKAMENHDQVNLTVEFEKEHTLTVAGSTCNEVGLEPMIRGHKGNIYLGGRHCLVRPERIAVDDVDERTIECPDIGNDQDKHRLGWLRSIRTREQPISGVELGTKIMVIVDLATRSMWEGCAYRFDPATLKASRV
ncbi:MAG TPA: Gfo/Idh/MocA family oxidoreductase, partial [Phycisphaerales bacterium]|nr:Gfo/Idh/MocA family oxidoreductase [Phycisphaerales bacterium]